MQQVHYWKADWPQYVAIVAAFNVFWLGLTYLTFICFVRINLHMSLIQDLNPNVLTFHKEKTTCINFTDVFVHSGWSSPQVLA